jgi:hypothetical protein
MRPIVLAVTLGAAIAGPAIAQNCSNDAQKQATDVLQDPYAFPIGRRFVVSDLWNDRPTRVGNGESRITDSVYQALMKFKKIQAVSIEILDLGDAQERQEAVKRGIFRLIDVKPTGIASDPTFREEGDYFTVRKFEYSNLQIGAATELKNVTDRYCLIQFTFRATFSPLLAPLFDDAEVSSRRVRLLNKWSPFARKWILAAFDDGPQKEGDFKISTVPQAIQNLSLAR